MVIRILRNIKVKINQKRKEVIGEKLYTMEKGRC